MSNGFLPVVREPTVGITTETNQLQRRGMSRPELDAASEALQDAADVASPELAAELAAKADTVADLATRHEGPDHGRLARLEHALRQFAEDGSAEVTDRVEQALEHVREYRKTVEGV